MSITIKTHLFCNGCLIEFSLESFPMFYSINSLKVRHLAKQHGWITKLSHKGNNEWFDYCPECHKKEG